MFKKEKKSDEIQMVVLRTTNNNYELNLIKALLDEHKILYLIRDQGIGGYMRIIGGSSIYATDILIDESDLEKSEAILNEFSWGDDKI